MGEDDQWDRLRADPSRDLLNGVLRFLAISDVRPRELRDITGGSSSQATVALATIVRQDLVRLGVAPDAAPAAARSALRLSWEDDGAIAVAIKYAKHDSTRNKARLHRELRILHELADLSGGTGVTRIPQPLTPRPAESTGHLSALVMTYVPGVNLYDAVMATNPERLITNGDVVTLACSLWANLLAHRRAKVAHRDYRLPNLIAAQAGARWDPGSITTVDFGFALCPGITLRDENGSDRASTDPEVAIAWEAPGRKRRGTRTFETEAPIDVYQWAVNVYMAVHRRGPFHGNEQTWLHRDPSLIETIDFVGVPPVLVDAVRIGLSHDPADRDVEAITRILAPLSGGAMALEATRTTQQHIESLEDQRQRIATALGAGGDLEEAVTTLHTELAAAQELASANEASRERAADGAALLRYRLTEANEAHAKAGAEVTRLESEVARRDRDIATMRGELARAGTDGSHRHDLEAQLVAAREDVQRLDQARHTATGDVTRAAARITTLERALAAERRRADELTSHVTRLSDELEGARAVEPPTDLRPPPSDTRSLTRLSVAIAIVVALISVAATLGFVHLTREDAEDQTADDGDLVGDQELTSSHVETEGGAVVSSEQLSRWFDSASLGAAGEVTWQHGGGWQNGEHLSADLATVALDGRPRETIDLHDAPCVEGDDEYYPRVLLEEDAVASQETVGDDTAVVVRESDGSERWRVAVTPESCALMRLAGDLLLVPHIDAGMSLTAFDVESGDPSWRLRVEGVGGVESTHMVVRGLSDGSAYVAAGPVLARVALTDGTITWAGEPFDDDDVCLAVPTPEITWVGPCGGGGLLRVWTDSGEPVESLIRFEGGIARVVTGPRSEGTTVISEVGEGDDAHTLVHHLDAVGVPDWESPLDIAGSFVSHAVLQGGILAILTGGPEPGIHLLRRADGTEAGVELLPDGAGPMSLVAGGDGMGVVYSLPADDEGRIQYCTTSAATTFGLSYGRCSDELDGALRSVQASPDGSWWILFSDRAVRI